MTYIACLILCEKPHHLTKRLISNTQLIRVWSKNILLNVVFLRAFRCSSMFFTELSLLRINDSYCAIKSSPIFLLGLSVNYYSTRCSKKQDLLFITKAAFLTQSSNIYIFIQTLLLIAWLLLFLNQVKQKKNFSLSISWPYFKPTRLL